MSSVFDNNIKVDASGNATVEGDLTVSGDTTTLSTTNSVVSDKLIELANGTSGTPSGDAGIVVERGSSDNAALIWDESADTWKACTTSATGASTGDLTLTDAALASAAITASGNITTSGDIILDDGGSLKEAGGTAAITFDGSGHVTKIGQDSMSSGDVLTWDGSKFVGEAPTVGDITGVTAGVGLSGGGSSGALTLTLDLSELSDVTPANGDKLATLDSDGANEQLTTVAGLATLFAGTGLTASSSVIGVDASQTQITAVGTIATGTWQGTAIANAYVAALPTSKITSGTFADARIAESNVTQHLGAITATGAVNSGSITSGFTSIDVGAGNISGGDITASGGDIALGNGQNGTVAVAATAHNAAGKNLTITAGPTTAGTTNNIAGGSLTIQAGQGKGSGAGGDIVFQTANAAGSGSSLNSHATALTISDDLGATFAGDVIITDGNLKLGSTAVGATAAEINAACDADGRTAAAVAVADDHILFCDGGATGATKVEAIADLMTAVAGTGLSASSGVLNVDASQTGITAVGTIATGTWQGTAIASAYLDADTAHLSGTQTFSGAKTFSADVVISGTTPQLTIGDGGAEDTLLVFDGNAADFRVGLDDGTDVLEIGVGAAHGTTTAIGVNANAQTQVLAAFAANVAGTFGTFADADATPSVATGNLWKHHASAQTITMFDDGIAGQTIHVISTAAIVYDVTSTNLKGGSADITTASGDITSWFFDGTNWYLIQFMDVSADMSSVGGGGGTDLNGLSAAAVDVSADSIGIIDANDSNASKKESLADLATAMAGDGVTATNGVFSVLDAAAAATADVAADIRSTTSQAGEILAMHVFS